MAPQSVDHRGPNFSIIMPAGKANEIPMFGIELRNSTINKIKTKKNIKYITLLIICVNIKQSMSKKKNTFIEIVHVYFGTCNLSFTGFPQYTYI